MFLATIGITVPSFVIATALIYVFAFRLGWFPVFGVHRLSGYVLPVVALAGYSIAFITRLMRSSLLEVMNQDYIRTARAKGLSEPAVIFRHAMRNALIPVVTILGPTLASLITGSFVVERYLCFQYGRLVTSISTGTTLLLWNHCSTQQFCCNGFYC